MMEPAAANDDEGKNDWFGGKCWPFAAVAAADE